MTTIARTEISQPLARPVAGAWPYAACGVLMLAAIGPLLWKFFVELWSRPQYEFFPLLLAAVPFVAVVCLRDTPADAVRPGGRAVPVLLWALAWACLLLGGAMYLKWLAPVAAWLTIAACVWSLGGRGLARALWPVGVLLLLVVPPPAHWDETILIGLRQAAVTCAGRLLDLIGVPQFTHGAVIDVPGDRLMVEEACSGINSMLAVLAFTVLLAFWKRLPAGALGVLVPAAAVFVFWANVLRIVVCATARVWYGVDLLTGTPHELLGLGLFLACMGLVFSTERLGAAVWSWDDRPDPPPAAATLAAGGRKPGLRMWIGVATAFVMTGAFVGWRTASAWPASALPAGTAFTLPTELAGWTRVGDDEHAPERAEVSGRQSRLYQYRRGSLLATVGVDYPFYGFHDATTCYRLAGWQVGDVTDRGPRRDDGPVRFDVAMQKAPLSKAVMRFALCDEAGDWWRRPDALPSMNAVQAALFKSRRRALALPLAQVQVLLVDYRPPSDEALADVDRLFDAAATAFASGVRQWGQGRSR